MFLCTMHMADLSPLRVGEQWAHPLTALSSKWSLPPRTAHLIGNIWCIKMSSLFFLVCYMICLFIIWQIETKVISSNLLHWHRPWRRASNAWTSFIRFIITRITIFCHHLTSREKIISSLTSSQCGLPQFFPWSHGLYRDRLWQHVCPQKAWAQSAELSGWHYIPPCLSELSSSPSNPSNPHIAKFTLIAITHDS